MINALGRLVAFLACLLLRALPRLRARYLAREGMALDPSDGQEDPALRAAVAAMDADPTVDYVEALALLNEEILGSEPVDVAPLKAAFVRKNGALARPDWYVSVSPSARGDIERDKRRSPLDVTAITTLHDLPRPGAQRFDDLSRMLEEATGSDIPPGLPAPVEGRDEDGESSWLDWSAVPEGFDYAMIIAECVERTAFSVSVAGKGRSVSVPYDRPRLQALMFRRDPSLGQVEGELLPPAAMCRGARSLPRPGLASLARRPFRVAWEKVAPFFDLVQVELVAYLGDTPRLDFISEHHPPPIADLPEIEYKPALVARRFTGVGRPSLLVQEAALGPLPAVGWRQRRPEEALTYGALVPTSFRA